MKELPVAPFEIGGSQVAAGTRQVVELPVSLMSNGLAANLRAMVIHGKKAGPRVFVSAAIHGDEIVGAEIIRRLIARPSLKTLHGTLILVPIVNGYGFLNHSRYLPDRRDLNRCFPGSPTGSLASRLANVFLTEIVQRCHLGVDLHSAAIHRQNLPQLRINHGSPQALELARAFAPPVVLLSKQREGSLRHSAGERGIPVLLFEGGEGLRFEETAVRAGLSGILRVLRHIEMVSSKRIARPTAPPFIGRKSEWIRAESGGLVRLFKKLGDAVTTGERIGAVSGPFGLVQADVVSTVDGIIIGRTNQPVVNEGDALVHIALAEQLDVAAERVEQLVEQLDTEEMFYEDEIL